MRSKHSFFCLLLFAYFHSPILRAREFTDLEGRKVEAELVGIRGENAILAVKDFRGQWPISKLSAADREYVTKWRSEHTGVKRVQVRLFERSGAGPKGAFPVDGSASAGSGNGLAAPAPLLPPPPKTTEKKSGHHGEVQLTNTEKGDAARLRVAYVLYLLQPDGSVGASAGSQYVESLKAGAVTTLTTEGITATKTKATKLKVSYSNQGGLSVAEKNAITKEKFGGVWVKVYGADGAVLGEAKELAPELEKATPRWHESEPVENISVINSFAELLEKIGQSLPPIPLPRP